MRIDVLLGDAPVVPADVADRVVVAIDVLRAATTVAVALAHGARTVIPFETVEAAAQRARSLTRGEVLLAGERRMQRIDGFDLGNSPLEMAPELVEGKTLLYTTTNGTQALAASHGSRVCFFAGFVNVSATVRAVRAALSDTTDVMILCAGHQRRLALEDIVCAGRLVRGIAQGQDQMVKADGARVAELVERPFVGGVSSVAHEATHARSLSAAGFDADITACLTLDRYDWAVRYHDRQLSRHGVATGR